MLLRKILENEMRKIIYILLILAGMCSGVTLAGGVAPPPVATPALDSWGIMGLMLLLPVVAAFVYKKKK